MPFSCSVNIKDELFGNYKQRVSIGTYIGISMKAAVSLMLVIFDHWRMNKADFDSLIAIRWLTKASYETYIEGSIISW